jgi:predicted unusual protein kinase regulating ubiquinone biosynthesis (AarF/ABC1/UbiB family)
MQNTDKFRGFFPGRSMDKIAQDYGWNNKSSQSQETRTQSTFQQSSYESQTSHSRFDEVVSSKRHLETQNSINVIAKQIEVLSKAVQSFDHRTSVANETNNALTSLNNKQDYSLQLLQSLHQSMQNIAKDVQALQRTVNSYTTTAGDGTNYVENAETASTNYPQVETTHRKKGKDKSITFMTFKITSCCLFYKSLYFVCRRKTKKAGNELQK